MKLFFKTFLLNLRNFFSFDKLAEKSFDQKYSIDTSGFYELYDEDVAPSMIKHGHDYQGTPVSFLKEIIGKIPEHPSNFTFIDYGSGFGRTLFASLEIGFKSIIGIEY